MQERVLNNLEIMNNFDQESFAHNLSKIMNDQTIEEIAVFLEEFYGLDDDDEIGMLTQVFLSGVLSTLEKLEA